MCALNTFLALFRGVSRAGAAFELQVKHERGIGRNRALRRCAVTELPRDIYNPAVADAHVLQRSGEAGHGGTYEEMRRSGEGRAEYVVIGRVKSRVIEDVARGVRG